MRRACFLFAASPAALALGRLRRQPSKQRARRGARRPRRSDHGRSRATSPSGRATPRPSRRRSRSWPRSSTPAPAHHRHARSSTATATTRCRRCWPRSPAASRPTSPICTAPTPPTSRAAAKLVTLNNYVSSEPSFGWDHFYPFEREVATVNGKVVGHSRAGRQPRARLQQEAVRAGRDRPADGQLDVDGLRERRAEAHQPGQEAVRLGLRQRRQRGHRLALLGDALAGGRPDPHADNKQAAFDSPAGLKALTLLQQPRRSTSRSTSTTAPTTTSRCSTPATSACCGPARGTSSRSPPSKVRLRRADPAGGREPPDDLRPRQLGHVQQRLARASPRRGVPEVADLAQDRPAVGSDDRRSADPRRRRRQLPGYKSSRPSTRASTCGSRTSTTRTRPVPSSTTYPKISTAIGPGGAVACCSARPSPSRRSRQAAQQVNGILSAPG